MFDFLGCDRALDTPPLVRLMAARRDERIARRFSLLASEFLRALQPTEGGKNGDTPLNLRHLPLPVRE
jgi:hypothetical protein